MKQCGAGKKCPPSPRPKIKCLPSLSENERNSVGWKFLFTQPPPPVGWLAYAPWRFSIPNNALGPKNLRTTDLELTKNNSTLNNKNLQLGQPIARVVSLVTLCRERDNRDTKSVSNEGTQYMQTRHKRLFSHICYHIIIAKFGCPSAARPVPKVYIREWHGVQSPSPSLHCTNFINPIPTPSPQDWTPSPSPSPQIPKSCPRPRIIPAEAVPIPAPSSHIATILIGTNWRTLICEFFNVSQCTIMKEFARVWVWCSCRWQK